MKLELLTHVWNVGEKGDVVEVNKETATRLVDELKCARPAGKKAAKVEPEPAEPEVVEPEPELAETDEAPGETTLFASFIGDRNPKPASK